jgi:hypothetical protein
VAIRRKAIRRCEWCVSMALPHVAVTKLIAHILAEPARRRFI